MTKSARFDLPGKIAEFVTAKSRVWAGLPGNVRGAIWAMLAAGFFSVMITLIKIVGSRLHVTEILLFRQGVMLMFTVPALMHNFPAVLVTRRADLHILRVMVAMVAMVLGFSAFIHLPLTDATTIAFAKSFFTTMFAIMILGEVVGPRRWFAVAVGFIGVVIAMRPGFSADLANIYGLMALGGAAGAAFVMVIIRKLSQTDRPVTILIYQALGVGAAMIPPAIWFWITPSFREFLLLLVLGAVSVAAQMCNILAYRAGEANVMGSLDYTRLIYVVAIGFWVFGDWPDAYVLTGAAIIIGASLYTIHREARIGRGLSGASREQAESDTQ